MSRTLLHATGVLCRLLEQDRPRIHGSALFAEGHLGGGRELLHERLLVLGPPLTHVTCPDCGVELARVVREVALDRFQLYCDECGRVDAGREQLQTYSVNLARFVDRLADSLDLSATHRKMIDPDRSWRLGLEEVKRGRARTWYFARHLNDHRMAKHLLDQIRADGAAQSARILTSTEVPLSDGSPLANYDVKHLAAVARLSQSRFIFFDDRVETGVLTLEAEPTLDTSLRLVRERGWVYVDRRKYVLESMQQKILLALMDAHDHRLEANEIRALCGSEAYPFQPIKFFGRNKPVYQAFIHYVPGDRVYELCIHPEDVDWF